MDPTTATTTKKLGNGQTVTYTYWRGAFTDTNGDRRFVNLGNVDVTTKKQARDKLAEMIRSSRRPTAASITVEQWCRTYIDRLDLARATINQYEVALRCMIDCWGRSKRLRSVTAGDIAELIATMGKEVADYTVRNRCVSAKAMFDRATREPSRERPYLAFNPFDDADIPNPKQASTFVYVSPDQTAKILDACPTANWRSLVALTRLCALRLEEALNVDVSHLHWNLHAVAVKVREDRDGKGEGTKQRYRMVPMSPLAYRLVLARFEELGADDRMLIDREPLTKGTRMSPQDHMRRIFDAAGVVGVVKPFHDLRKSQAQDWSVLHGCEHSARWCGHSIEVALRHYRDNEQESLGLVTGLDDPKAKLAAAYARLEARR